MVEKVMCDKCGEEISKHRMRYKLKLFNQWNVKTNMDKDLCVKCLNELGVWKIQ